MTERKDATKATKDVNDKLLEELPFEDRRDFEDAERGFIAPLPDGGVIRGEDGSDVWNTSKFSFIEEDSPAPDTVTPSLWRQSQLVLKGGLFKVTDRLYQVRNADLSNLTIVEGDTGLIVFDPLITTEAAQWALELYFARRPRKPVLAVNAMSRRATYMYGNLLAPDPKGQVGAGLGMTTSVGTITLIPPTDEITETGQKMTIDGLTFEFLLAPDTEAPAEMHWFIEELGALTAAENCCHTLHNTYTLRGAAIRDPQAWSRYLNETIDRWGHKTEVMYGMHHWPVWGTDRVLELLRKGRDAYRYINDQTLRLANHGHTPVEIAEMIELPDGLAHHWALRGYYGTVNHNVRATYVKYLGWFDGNPANLHTLPPEEVAKRYVEFMGGAEATLKKARSAYESGEYRWVAEVVNHVVFADPGNAEARQLQADALEQMGYQAEAGPSRHFYLTGAKEVAEGG